MLQINSSILVFPQSFLVLLLVLLNELPISRLKQAADLAHVLRCHRLALFCLDECIVQLAKLQKVEHICFPQHSYELRMELAIVLRVEHVDAAVPAERLLISLVSRNAALWHKLLPKGLDEEVLVV